MNEETIHAFETSFFMEMSNWQHHSKYIRANAQHGFQKKWEVCTILVAFTQNILKHIDQKGRVDAVYTDFSKAFDKVHHGLLIRKIQSMGFLEPVIDFFRSYLEGRTQYVSYKGAESNIFGCPLGVPQGSVLAPLMFSIFINDAQKEIVGSKLLMHADDIKAPFRFSQDWNWKRKLARVRLLSCFCNFDRVPNREKMEKRKGAETYDGKNTIRRVDLQYTSIYSTYHKYGR